MTSPLKNRFVTGQDFSRGESASPINGALSPAAKQTSPIPRHLLARLILLAALLLPDVLILAAIRHDYPLLGAIAPLGIASCAVFLGLGYTRLRPLRDDLPFNLSLFGAHVACVLAISLANFAALHGFALIPNPLAAHIAQTMVLFAAIACLALSCIPIAAWKQAIHATGWLWLYSLLAGVLAWALRFPAQSLWNASNFAPSRFLQPFTFRAVYATLHLILPSLAVYPDRFVLGTPNFSVFITEACSGMEGLSLVLVFTTLWLWYFRRESRFPQALLLIPYALIAVWILNVARICVLVLIGNAGFPDIAMVGFHSQAGWIAFTAVALAFSMATRHLRWVSKVAPSPTGPTTAAIPQTGESPATAAFLLPFLAILAASFVSKSASAHFEWLYPLRFVAAAIALWHYRAQYRKLNWKFGWQAPAAGTLVFLIWIAPRLWHPSAETSTLGTSLAALTPAARYTWLVFRVVAAVLTVPIAEELAFRGYLARRFVHREFDTVPFAAISWLPIAISSVAFGLMHGGQWIVGTLAGLIFALLLKRSGRIGDAVAAHATANLLLAAWVLARADWGLW